MSALKQIKMGEVIPMRSSKLSNDDVLTALKAVGYSWNLATDVLEWGSNLQDVYELASLASLKSGSDYSAQVMHNDRAKVILSSKEKDVGDGVAYLLQTQIKRLNGEIITLQDKGKWFAGKTGEPVEAQGLVTALVSHSIEEVKPIKESRSSRSALTSALQKAIKQGSPASLVLISVDNISRINDVYGFEIADAVIEGVMDRIERMLRGGDILGRFTGNKIGVLMHRCNGAEMKIAAERFIEAIEDKSFTTKVGDISTSITVGGAIAPDHAKTSADLISNASEALRNAREQRRGSFEAYTPSEQREILKREMARTTEEVIAALNRRDIALAYQPIVQANTPRETIYYECLLRLKRPDGTTIGAPTVIALAEKLGLVRLLDKLILDLAIEEMTRSPNLKLSVNVTPASTIDDDWVENLRLHVKNVPSIPERLIVEITETSAILDINETKRFVRRVKDIGARVAIDDFGAGYTSFKNLRMLGVDIVKLDGSFIENIENNPDDAHFVETLLNLANHMGLSTIAEWVQSESAAQKLADMGCKYLQGYYTGMASEAKPWIK
jgi:diguanylate cyclase (GGDEF)-like protein